MIEFVTVSATLYTFATIIGFSTGGMLSDHYGKRKTVFAFNFFAFICWIISSNATTKWLLFISYSLQGLFGSIAYNSVGKININLSSLLTVN